MVRVVRLQCRFVIACGRTSREGVSEYEHGISHRHDVLDILRLPAWQEAIGNGCRRGMRGRSGRHHPFGGLCDSRAEHLHSLCHYLDMQRGGLLDVFPTHGTDGIFGTVLTGIFIQEGLISGTWEGVVVFLLHLLAIVIVFAYTFGMSWIGYRLVDSLIPMRVSPYSEKVGLDFSQHDEHYGLAHIGEREIAEYEEHIKEKSQQ